MISKVKPPIFLHPLAIFLYTLLPICHIFQNGFKNICSFPLVIFIYSSDSFTKMYSGIQEYIPFFLMKNHKELCQKKSLIRNISILFCHFSNIIWMSLFQLLLILVLIFWISLWQCSTLAGILTLYVFVSFLERSNYSCK